MKIAENMDMLVIGGSQGNMYPVLIWDASEVVLIDAGLPLQFDVLEKEINRAGFQVSAITKIILTHQDVDHIGCVKEILEHAPHCKVLTHVEEAPYINGEKTPVKLAQMEANLEHLSEEMKNFYPSFKEAFANRRIKIDQTMQDGEVLPIAGGLEMIHTPGHTPGHMCVYAKQARILITGDGLNITDGKLTGPNEHYTADMDVALQSVTKMQAYDVAAIVCYHGGLYDGPFALSL